MQFAGLGSRQLVHEFDFARVFEWRNAGLHMVLQCLHQRVIAREPGPQHTKRLDDHAARVIRLANHAALGHRRVLEQCVFHLRRAHVVTGGDDHVVGAGLVEKVAIGILQERVAGVVPAIFHIVALTCVTQVFAARGADHRELAHRATRLLGTVVVHHLRGVARHHLADGTASHIRGRSRDEDVKHLGGTNAVQHLDAGGVFPQLARGVRQGLARAHADAQGWFAPRLCQRFHKRCHLPIKRGGRVANGGAHLKHQAGHYLGRVGHVGEIHRGSGPHREDQQTTQPEGERQRRRTHHDIAGCGLEHMARPGFAGGQHIAMRVHRRFGLAGGAGGEGHQRDVGRCGGAGLEVAVFQCRACGQGARLTGGHVERHDGGEHRMLRLRQMQFLQQLRVTQRHGGL